MNRMHTDPTLCICCSVPVIYLLVSPNFHCPSEVAYFELCVFQLSVLFYTAFLPM